VFRPAARIGALLSARGCPFPSLHGVLLLADTRFLFRSSILVMAFYGLSRLTGFVKLLLMTRLFGVSAEADAFAAAYQLPELLVTMLAGGAVAAAFIPVYTAQLASRDPRRAEQLANTVVTLTVVGMGLITVLVFYTAPWVTTHLLTPGFPPAQQQLTADLVRVLMLAMWIYAIGSIYASILQSHNHFLAPALGTVLIDVGQIVGVVALSSYLGILSAAWGLVAGAFLILAVEAPFLWRLGIRTRPALAVHSEGLRELGHLFWPRLVTMGAVQAADLIVVRLASGLPAGSMSAYFYAVLIMAYMPRGLFAQAIATVIFPTMARQYNGRNLEGLQNTMTGGLRAALSLVIPAAVGILALGMPAMHFLFPGEALDGEALAMVFALVAILSVRLIGDSCVDILSLAFYARHDTRTPMIASVLWVLAVLALSVPLVGPLGIYGLAWASSLASAGLAFGLFYAVLTRFRGIATQELVRTLARIGVAAAVMAFAVRIMSQMNLPETLFVVVGIGAGAGVYALVYVALGEREVFRWLRSSPDRA
jgi:putative peptidoglycan lipid II flippase